MKAHSSHPWCLAESLVKCETVEASVSALSPSPECDLMWSEDVMLFRLYLGDCNIPPGFENSNRSPKGSTSWGVAFLGLKSSLLHGRIEGKSCDQFDHLDKCGIGSIPVLFESYTEYICQLLYQPGRFVTVCSVHFISFQDSFIWGMKKHFCLCTMWSPEVFWGSWCSSHG